MMRQLQRLFRSQGLFRPAETEGQSHVSLARVAQKLGRVLLRASDQPLAKQRVEEADGIVLTLDKEGGQLVGVGA